MSDSRLAWNAASSARALARCAGKSFIWPRQKSACVRTFDLSNPSFALARRLRSSLSPSSPPAICAAFATVRSAIEDGPRQRHLVDGRLHPRGFRAAVLGDAATRDLLAGAQQRLHLALRLLLDHIRQVESQPVVPGATCSARRSVFCDSGSPAVPSLVRVARLVQHHRGVQVVEELRLRLRVVPRGGVPVPLGVLDVSLVDPDVGELARAVLGGAVGVGVALARRRRRAQPLSHHLERLLGLLDLALLGEQDAQPVGGEQVGLALLQRLGVHRRGVLQVFLHRLGGLLVRRGAVAVARALRPHRLVVRRVGHRDHRVLVRGVRRRLGVLARRRRELRRLRAQRPPVRRAQQLELRLRVRPPALLHQQVPEERHRVGVRRRPPPAPRAPAPSPR